MIAAATSAVLLLFGRKRAALFSAIAAAGIVYVSSTNLVGDALLEPLETEYRNPSLGRLPSPIDFVVVLGSGYSPRDAVPVTGSLADDGLARIVEGVRIFRQLPAARLIVSGGAADGQSPSAVGYAILAQELGVERKDLEILGTPLDTQQEAQIVSARVGARPFILVTSAYHMPRAMRLMNLAGLHPIAAPTGQLAHIAPLTRWGKLMPTSTGLRKTERAIHEYLGLAALRWGIA
jgi:uncharacterized SAM-binding protein YcdF (DUF218 family)